MEKINEKLDKLNMDFMGIQIKMAVLDRVINRQKEIEKSIEMVKQNQNEIMVDVKDCHLKIEKLDEKAENLTILLEKTRSTVAKKIKKVKNEIQDSNNTLSTFLEKQENANVMTNIKLNKNAEKTSEIADQLIAMQMMGQEMNDQMKMMDNLMRININQVNQMNEQIEECKQITLDTKSSEFSVKKLKQVNDTSSEQIEILMLQINNLVFENEKLFAKERIRNLQELEEKNNFHQMQQLIAYGKPNIQRFSLFDHYSDHNADYTWKIIDIQTKEVGEYESETFAFNEYPIGFKAKLSYAPGKCVLEICFKKREKCQETPNINMPPKVYFILKGQQKIKDELLSSAYTNLSQPLKFDIFYHVSYLQLNCPNFVSNLSITLDMFVEPLSVSRQIYSHDGTLFWSVEKYIRKIQRSSQESQFPCESPYFYTSANEYKLQCIMSFANCGIRQQVHGRLFGSSSGQASYTLLSAQIRFLPADLDVDLSKLQFHMTTISVFNIKYPYAHVENQLVGDITMNNICSFTVQSNYGNENFALNDILFYKVNVELFQELPKVLPKTKSLINPNTGTYY